MTELRGPEPEAVGHVVDVLRALVALLSRFGIDDHAQWLEQRRSALEADAGLEDVLQTLAELHAVVLGMGGLMDLYLSGNSASETEEANAELERLADQLFELTR